MTVAGIRSTAPRQTGLKSLAGALAFLCLVLFLLAIEQKQAVAAWAAVRDEAAPAAGRVADWAGRLASGEGDGLTGLKSAIADDGNPRVAAPTHHRREVQPEGQIAQRPIWREPQGAVGRRLPDIQRLRAGIQQPQHL